MFDWDKLIDVGVDIAKVATAGTPVGLAINVLDVVVDKDTNGVGVDNEEIIKLLKVAAKSSHNKVDDKLLCLVESYLKCESNV